MLHLLKLKAKEGLIYQPKRGLLRIFGSEAKDFLQRLTTQNLLNLSYNNPVMASVINHQGKMIEYVAIFLLNDNDILLVTSSDDNKKLYHWLQQFHFLEEINFDLDVVLPLAIIITAKPITKSPILGKITLDNITYSIYLTISDEHDHFHEIDDDIWEALRIIAVIPKLPEEINDRFMPHNINLSSSIAYDKGCYIGQEVILKAAKQKRKKNLTGLILPRAEWAQLSIGTTVIDELGKDIYITSRSPIYVESLPCVLGIKSL